MTWRDVVKREGGWTAGGMREEGSVKTWRDEGRMKEEGLLASSKPSMRGYGCVCMSVCVCVCEFLFVHVAREQVCACVR